MTEDQVRSDIGERFGSAALARLDQFVGLLLEEGERQNLISASTAPTVWSRHILDSLQLVDLVSDKGGDWIDIGSGGGLPGLPVAIVREGKTILVEPRRKRAEFLQEAATTLGIAGRVEVIQQRIERVAQTGAILSARAVASIESLFEMAHHIATAETTWLLPRGRIEPTEIEQLRQRWRFMFHVEQSRVDQASAIAIFKRVSRR